MSLPHRIPPSSQLIAMITCAHHPLPPVFPDPAIDDEVQLGASLLAHESQPSSRVEGASCIDSRVGVTHVRREITVNLRAASLSGEFREYIRILRKRSFGISTSHAEPMLAFAGP